MYSKENVVNKFPDIIDDATLEKIIDLLNTLETKENERSQLATAKIKLEAEIEDLKKQVGTLKSLVELIPRSRHKEEEKREKVFTFGIISPGEGNTRIGSQ